MQAIRTAQRIRGSYMKGRRVGAGTLISGMGTLSAQEKPKDPKHAREFAPGEKPATSGIYHVINDKLDGHDHTQLHQVTVTAAALFPACKVCGEWVRFRLHNAAERIGDVSHFKS